MLYKMEVSPNNVKEFDSSLGGSIELPGVINIKPFVIARIEEMKSMRNAINNPKKTAMAFQQLPKHMRRRVMSYNIRRLPKRLREVHARMLAKSKTKEPGKRPSRKYRRRPRNLLSEYKMRKRKCTWLETHIWHAKRFHMLDLWDYKIPEYPNEKGFKACYRASMEHALVQDLSYYACIEIFGKEQELLKGLPILNSTGLTFSARPYLSGAREGFTYASHPLLCRQFGMVSFLWSAHRYENNVRKLWIWVHPSSCHSFQNILEIVFMNDEVRIALLKDEFVRFRLTGHKSLSVIMSCLSGSDLGSSPWAQSTFKYNPRKILHDNADKEHNDVLAGSSECDHSIRGSDVSNLFDPEAAEYQKDYLQKFSKVLSHNEICPRIAVPAIVKVTLPNRKVAFRQRDIDMNESVDHVCENLWSPLWDETGRERVKQYMSKRPVNPVIPVIIIHRPTKERGTSGGFDIIAGSGCGMALWLGLVHNGGRPGGLREMNHLEFLTGSYPLMPKNSMAGNLLEGLKTNQSKEKYYRLPPAKRPNYIKLSVACPFGPDWNLLIREWGYQSLKRIKLVALKKGVFKRCSMICLPTIMDRPGSLVKEDYKKDNTAPLRRKLKLDHKKKLRTLSRARKKARQKKDKEKLDQNLSKDVVASHSNQMKQLWVPSPLTVRNSASREIAGFVTEGNYHLGYGRAVAYGYISPAAESIVGNYYLVRSTESNVYRWAQVFYV